MPLRIMLQVHRQLFGVEDVSIHTSQDSSRRNASQDEATAPEVGDLSLRHKPALGMLELNATCVS